MKIEMKRQKFIKDKNGKFVKQSEESETITESYYENTVLQSTVDFFRQLGGEEDLKYGTTVAGRKVVEIISTFDNQKIVRTFKFSHD